MHKMTCFNVRSLVYLLQIRCLRTTTTAIASHLVDSTPKPFATVFNSITKPKTQKLDEPILSEKDESAIALFKKYQFSDVHISSLVQKKPQVLKCNVESILEPKLNFLNENGLVGTSLANVIITNPHILLRSLSDCLIPNLDYLKRLLNNDMAAIVLSLKKAAWLLTTDLKKVLQPNIDLLLNEGVEMSSVLKLLTLQPRCLLFRVEKIRDGIERIKKFGIKPTSRVFIYTFRAVGLSKKSILDKKIEIFRNLGCTDEDIASIMARQPLCLSQSEDKLSTSLEYFVKTMGLKPGYLINHPTLLMYSLTKRSIPRCKVITALKEKGLIKDIHLVSFIVMPSKDFTRRFILKYPTLSASLWTLYLGKPVVDDIPV